MTTVYPIHRAIARPVIFKGFQAQYILYAAGALIADLFLFFILYCCKVNPWICIPFAIVLGAAALYGIGRLSHKYGVHGLIKLRALQRMPHYVACPSRRPFTQINKTICHTA